MSHIDFILDGEMSGSGLRDALNGGYVEPRSLGFSETFAHDLAVWQVAYEGAHCFGFPPAEVTRLDREGMALTLRAGHELPHRRFGYFSAGLMNDLS